MTVDFPSHPLRAGSAGLCRAGALLLSGASLPLMAKPRLGCHSTSPTLDATGLGMVSEGSTWVLLAREGFEGQHSLCDL